MQSFRHLGQCAVDGSHKTGAFLHSLRMTPSRRPAVLGASHQQEIFVPCRVGGSLAVTPNFAGTASYSSASFDFLGNDIKAKVLSIGITAHTSVAPSIDVLGNISVARGEGKASNSFNEVSDTGNIITVGIRYLMAEDVEFSLGFSRADLLNDTANSSGLSVNLYGNEKVSLGFGYSAGDNESALSFSIRVDL